LGTILLMIAEYLNLYCTAHKQKSIFIECLLLGTMQGLWEESQRIEN
jgi:hypothetical protein